MISRRSENTLKVVVVLVRRSRMLPQSRMLARILNMVLKFRKLHVLLASIVVKKLSKERLAFDIPFCIIFNIAMANFLERECIVNSN
jgi:hypothetical protein